jgi:hypothetical protein
MVSYLLLSLFLSPTMDDGRCAAFYRLSSIVYRQKLERYYDSMNLVRCLGKLIDVDTIRLHPVAFEHRQDRVDHWRRAAGIGFYLTLQRRCLEIAVDRLVDEAPLAIPNRVGIQVRERRDKAKIRQLLPLLTLLPYG